MTRWRWILDILLILLMLFNDFRALKWIFITDFRGPLFQLVNIISGLK